MNTASFITASAQITRITELVKGDVFKRLEESSYASKDKIVFGVVTDVLHNGDNAAICAMEFEPSYSGLSVELVTYAGNRDLKIFPATQTELQAYLEDAQERCDREVETKRKELAASEEKAKRVTEIISGELTKQLTTPKFTDAMPEAIEATDG